MRGPVISYQQAQELNARVQSKLAPYLFACCNYEPTSLHVLSEDGWFTVGIFTSFPLMPAQCSIVFPPFFPTANADSFQPFATH